MSFATVYWIDVFVRDQYFNTVLESLKYCQEHKGMEVYVWCIMTSHVHLIFRARDENPSDLLKEFKTYTSKQLQKEIAANQQESKRELLGWLFYKAGQKKSNVAKGQFWQQHNKPIELWSSGVIDQKLDYLHQNPVESGFVSESEHWRYSSAIDYAGGKGLLAISVL